MAKETKEKKPSTAAEVLANLEKGGLEFGYKPKAQKFYTTGNVAVDWVCGGGLPVGKIIEAYGKSGSGKTTWAMQAVKEILDAGGTAVWGDWEFAFDWEYARKLGIDTDSDRFIYFQPQSLEQGCDAIKALVDTGEVDLVVVDSIARMTTESEINGSMRDVTVADKAKQLYKFCRMIMNSLENNNCSLIFLNHLLDAINTSMPGVKTKLTPGGNGVLYFASLRLEFTVIGHVNASGSDAKYSAVKIQILCTKNRVAPPSRKVEVQNDFGTGFNATRSVLEVAKQIGIVDASSAWTKVLDPKLAELLGKDQYQGFNNFVLAVSQNSAAKERLTKTALSVLQTGEIPE